MEHPLDRKRLQARAEQTVREMVSRNMAAAMKKPEPMPATCTAQIPFLQPAALTEIAEAMEHITRLKQEAAEMMGVPLHLLAGQPMLEGPPYQRGKPMPHPLTGR